MFLLKFLIIFSFYNSFFCTELPPMIFCILAWMQWFAHLVLSQFAHLFLVLVLDVVHWEWQLDCLFLVVVVVVVQNGGQKSWLPCGNCSSSTGVPGGGLEHPGHWCCSSGCSGMPEGLAFPAGLLFWSRTCS